MKTEINIEGMSCQHCVKHATEALNGLANVSNVVVNLENKQAVIESTEIIDDQLIKNTIIEAGYEVKGINRI